MINMRHAYLDTISEVSLGYLHMKKRVVSHEKPRSRLLLKLDSHGKQLTATRSSIESISRAILPFYDNVISARLPMS